MLSRFLDWLDEAAAGLIRVAYLLAGITAVAVYFGAGHLPASVQDVLDGALPWCLAGAVETHTYLSARRVRSAWQDIQAASLDSQERIKAIGAIRVNLGVLAFLVAFSCWNQLNYLYDTWTPPHTALALPGWLAYVVRALVIPAAFMAAAFLAPLALPIAAQIETEARATLADVFKIARRQRRRMLKSAEREGRDMTGALVELVTDNELRRVISHAYSAIATTPAVALLTQVPAVAAPIVAVQPAPAVTPDPDPAPANEDDPTPPDDGGSGVTSKSAASAVAYGPTLRLMAEPRARKGVQKERAGRGKSVVRGTAEQRIRELVRRHPKIGFNRLVSLADVTESTASKWLAVIEAEKRGTQEGDMRA